MNDTPAVENSLSPAVADGSGPGTELAISVEPEGILVAGDPEVVAGYLARMTDLAGEALDVSGVSKSSMAGAAAAVFGVQSVLAQAGQFVRLSPESVQALKTHRVLPGDNGFFRMTVVDQSGKFRNQLQWQKVPLGPTQALSLQLLAVQVALSAAIASVNESIARVDGKVEQLLVLAQATRVGDVVGHFSTLERLVATLDDHDALPTADWESVAALRPALSVTIERLREHVKRTLAGFDPTRPVQDRADYLRRAIEENRLGESLHLLVVSEQSLYLWQRLRIARVQATEPQHLQTVLDDSRALLAEHFERDGQLLLHARSELSNFAQMRRLDGFRWGAAHNLTHDIVTLKSDLDDLRRHAAVKSWGGPSTRVLVLSTHSQRWEVELSPPAVRQEGRSAPVCQGSVPDSGDWGVELGIWSDRSSRNPRRSTYVPPAISPPPSMSPEPRAPRTHLRRNNQLPTQSSILKSPTTTTFCSSCYSGICRSTSS